MDSLFVTLIQNKATSPMANIGKKYTQTHTQPKMFGKRLSTWLIISVIQLS